jgi:hypothetical protein
MPHVNWHIKYILRHEDVFIYINITKSYKYELIKDMKISVKCDRTTSEMRGLSPKIILGDSRRSENAQTHTNRHTIPNMKFKLKLLQIKCHVLGFIKDKAKNVLQELIRVLRKRSSLTIDTRSSP